MFRKKIEVKSSTLLKTTEKKKFRKTVEETFCRFCEDDETGNEGSMPSEVFSMLGKGDVALVKASMDNGNKQFEFYTLDKTPIFFVADGYIYPTVYLLWMAPAMLPRLYTHAEVFEKLKNGADLMLPGIILPSNSSSPCFDFESDAVCCICIKGNDAPLAIGRTLMSSSEMMSSELRRGKAVNIFHTYQDALWELGPKTRAPVISLPEKPNEPDVQRNDADEAASITASFDKTILLESERQPPENNSDQSAASSMDKDTLFLLYFLYALKERLRRDDDLPILASTFYGNILLPLMPSEEEKRIPVQQTTYKKFSTFLRTMQSLGVIVIEEPKKGVENIARINRSHEIFRQYVVQLESLLTSEKTNVDPSQPSVVNEKPVNFRELRAITAHVLPLFQEVNKSLKKGQALSVSDIRAVVTSYVKSKGLANGRLVKLDDLLLRCISMSQAEKQNVENLINWETLIGLIFDRMTQCVEIEFADQGAHGESSRKEVHKGKAPFIRMKVAKRAGNKKVTMIDHVQAFGIDPKTFAQELQVALAVSATLNDAPASTGPQVQVQGDQMKKLQAILDEKYGISKKYIKID